MDVFPTAAFPHKTNLTAFLVLFLVSTLGCLSLEFFDDFDGPKHIKSLEFTYIL